KEAKTEVRSDEKRGPKGNRRKTYFFQAEDGIRDRNVTGVQTCALPISRLIHAATARHPNSFIKVNCGGQPEDRVEADLFGHEMRSEERRVGKSVEVGGWSIITK